MTAFPSVGMPTQADPSAFQQASQPTPADAAHEQAFADAVQRSAPVQQMDAQAASGGNGVMSTMTHRLDMIANHLQADPATDADQARQQALFSGDPASAGPPHEAAAATPLDSFNDTIREAISSYRSSAIFCIEGEVASNVSKTSTGTMNSLMKGS